MKCSVVYFTSCSEVYHAAGIIACLKKCFTTYDSHQNAIRRSRYSRKDHDKSEKYYFFSIILLQDVDYNYSNVPWNEHSTVKG